MRLRSVSLGLALFLALSSVAWAPAPEASRSWDHLGSRTVDFSVDRDAIPVTIREGTFRKIKLRVRRSAVTLRDVKIHYRNGDVQDVKIRRHIPAGGETRVIDLYGGDRVIQKVVFWYNTKPGRHRRATVELWGRN